MHVLPDLDDLEKAVEDILVIGVHSAKFDNEKISLNIKHAIERYDIKHPVVNDMQAVLWKQYLISCWPTFMVLDPKGRPVRKFVGEGHGKELIEFVNSKVNDFKKIRGGIIFRDEIPRNTVGKLMRKRMRDWAEKLDSEQM